MQKIILGLTFFGLLFTGSAMAQTKGCLDVDSASAKEIQKNLKGAGEIISKAIIAHRAKERKAATKAGKKTWNFGNWATLLKVKGLGPAFCKENVAKVCFAGKKTPQKACPKAKAKAKAKVKAKVKEKVKEKVKAKKAK